jgi:hypothetical protein
MGNEATRFQKLEKEPLGKPIGVRFPLDVQDFLAGFSPMERQKFIRAAVQAAIAGGRDPADLMEDVELAATFTPGSKWKVPAGWIAVVERVKNGRVFVLVNGGIEDDYPPHLLSPMDDEESDW